MTTSSTPAERIIGRVPTAPSWVQADGDGILYGEFGDGDTPMSFHHRIHDGQEGEDGDAWSVVVDQYVYRRGDRLVREAPYLTIASDDQTNGYSYWRDADTLRRLIAKCQAALEVLEQATKEHEQA